MIQIKLFRTLLTTALLSSTLLVQGQWDQKAAIWGFSQGVWGGQSYAVNGKVYFGGGYAGVNNYLNDNQVYDPATEKWGSRQSLPGTNTNRSGGIAFTINGKAYLGLGIQDFNSFTSPWVYLTDLWEYNDASDTWTQKASIPDVGRGFSGVFVLNNKAYIVSGMTTKSATGTDEVYEYDPATDKWTKKASYPVGTVANPFAFAIGNKGYISGGRLDGGSTSTNKTYEYDPVTDKWTAKKDFPLTAIAGGVAFSANGKGYCTWGSEGAGKYNKAMYAYHPSSDEWEYVSGAESIRPGRMFGIAQVIDGKAYLGAGWRLDGTTQIFYRDFFEFDPQGVLSVNNINNKEHAVAYPNPATDKVFIKNTKQGSLYEVYNIFGQQVLKGVISNSLSINTSSLTTGQYIIKMTDKYSSRQYKVAIQ